MRWCGGGGKNPQVTVTTVQRLPLFRIKRKRMIGLKECILLVSHLAYKSSIRNVHCSIDLTAVESGR